MSGMSRRGFLGLTAGASLAAGLTLAGCAGTGSSKSSGGAGGGSGNLQFWSNHPGKSKEVEQKLIDAFTAKTGIKVDLIDGGANYEELAQKFNAALSGGGLPDVIVASDVTWFNFALAKVTTPLDELWSKAGVDASSYVDTLREDYTFNGKHYGMPYSRSTPLMYLEKAAWAKAGFDGTGPATWEEFAKAADKVKAANGGKPALTIPDGTKYLDWYFQGMIWTFGGQFSKEWEPTFSAPESIEAGKFLQAQVKAGNIAISNDAANQFGAGQASGLLESTGALGGLTKQATSEFFTAYMPGPKPGCPTGGAGLAVPAGISEERKLNAVKFIDFMTNMENTITFTQATGYMPVRKGAVDQEAEKKYLGEHPNATVAIKQLADNTKSQDYARVFVPGGGKRIGAALDKITIGGEDVEKVFKALDEETKTVIARDIKPKL